LLGEFAEILSTFLFLNHHADGARGIPTLFLNFLKPPRL
jgi:hypothetical protein